MAAEGLAKEAAAEAEAAEAKAVAEAEEVVGDGEAVAIGITARKAVVKTETTLLNSKTIPETTPEITVRACRVC
jgi:uncharacterized membrane protein YqiK